ncbi:sulfurtransferase [Spiribacter halobius]|uniref:Rhodanese n=1 Tax=Sediminicurvatus halobius TaxID=2182432 RepID=A0A2U2N7C6_9GAMM|nr:rhodanese-like domain-containing protein [Spiribacter halobius]PWG64864.1 rhodanese [Spiribacter halobius]UEX78281.1 sulfurtransferase [Spiribacter halobius]
MRQFAAQRVLPRALLGLALLLPVAAAAASPAVVDAEWLRQHHDRVAVVETSRSVDAFADTGHIPGAAFVAMGEFLAEREGRHGRIRYLLPEAEAFQATVRGLGVDAGETVVIAPAGHTVYGDATVAARLYWQLRYYGHDDVAVLDGGVAAWRATGGAVTDTLADTAAGDFTARAPRSELLATSAEVEGIVAGEVNARLLDNRPLEPFAGLAGQDYVRGLGHLPGAEPLPFTLFVTEREGIVHWRSREEVRRLVQALVGASPGPMVTYCNSGHVSALAWFALSEIGELPQVRLYDGSLHEWTLDGDRELVIGR